jgi:hypothetical protein
VLIFLGAAPVIAGTDAEAHRLSREIFDELAITGLPIGAIAIARA